MQVASVHDRAWLQAPASFWDTLTPRQRLWVELRTSGLSWNEIAIRMGISKRMSYAYAMETANRYDKATLKHTH